VRLIFGMKAKTGIHIYHNTVLLSIRRLSTAHHKMEGSDRQNCLIQEWNQVLILSQG
jgi:hypothetical protein